MDKYKEAMFQGGQKVDFFLFADAHYTTKPQTGDRLHLLSADKLRYALNAERENYNFIVNLGDTTDAVPGYLPQSACFERMKEIMATSGKPYFSVIGNHDTATEKKSIIALCEMPGRYFSYDAGPFLCLFLDSSSNCVTEPYPTGLIDWERCMIDDAQFTWICDALCKARKPVLVFAHACFALKAGESEESHLILNREPIMRIFAQSSKVAAVFCGHYHPGDLQVVDGISYITLAAMCVGQENAYCVVRVKDGEIIVRGSGRQPSYRIQHK